MPASSNCQNPYEFTEKKQENVDKSVLYSLGLQQERMRSHFESN